MKTKAIIFDVDGVITDTEPVHMEAWLSILEPLGISFDETEYRANYIGLNDRDFLDAVGHIHGRHFPIEEKGDLIDDKASTVMKLLEHNVPLLPGVRDFVEASAKKYNLAICSGAGRGEIEFILKRLGWKKTFDPIVSADLVKKGKPDPEGYIRASEILADISSEMILQENIVAIEDSPKGIKAAKAAGLFCIAVSNSYDNNALSGADVIVKSLADIDLDELK